MPLPGQPGLQTETLSQIPQNTFLLREILILIFYLRAAQQSVLPGSCLVELAHECSYSSLFSVEPQNGALDVCGCRVHLP